MSLLHRRKKVVQRHADNKDQGDQVATTGIPPWAELSRLPDDAVRALATAHGIEYTTRMATLIALHKARS